EWFKAALQARDLSNADVNEIYWKEIVYRAHLSASVSLLRSMRWIEGTVREYQAHNLLGWAACARGLWEATGDSCYSLLQIPTSLAEAQHQVRSCIAGKETEKLVPSEIEELLVHFTHARRLPGKLKDAADATRAKDATEYIAALEKK